jgi:hypothetical protein
MMLEDNGFKVVEGKKYVKYVNSVYDSCDGCIGTETSEGELCTKLANDSCGNYYVFKLLKDEKSYSNVNPPAPSSRPPVPPSPLTVTQGVSVYSSNPEFVDELRERVQGVKYDDNKLQYSLIPPYALEAVAQNLTDGLKKYPERNNWVKVSNAQERYLDALYRHLEAHRKGEIYDTDNINPENTHMAAVVANALFLLEFMLNPKLKGKE